MARKDATASNGGAVVKASGSHIVNGHNLRVTKTDKDIDHRLDNEIVYEFGGPIGVVAMMIGFPMIMYYFWICLTYHHGKLIGPDSFTLDGFKEFFEVCWTHVKVDAFPTLYATKIYIGFCLVQVLFSYIMPGPWVKGMPVPSLNYAVLDYHCNAVASLYATLILSGVLHYYGILPLTAIIENLGPIMTVAIITGFAITIATYFITIALNKQHRMSGNFFYDLFMGAPLNPRIGKLDLKMWAEIRVPWIVLFYISLSAAFKQYELHGYVTPEMSFMVLAHAIYANTCQKGEECIPSTWDIFYEKWGFMLIFWNMAGVPFTYCYSTMYLMSFKDPKTISFSIEYYIFVYGMLLIGYYIWDTANYQKSSFRLTLVGAYKPRWTFPQLPGGYLKNPSYIKTKHGNYLLTSGWWGVVRKPNYTGDLFMSLSWGLICGIGSFLPYFYITFFTIVLVHRVSRDMERCKVKYGDDWVEYCKRVPYVFFPYIY